MKLLTLEVKGYKNFEDVEIDFSQSQRKTLVVGTNGSGKSNLLEIFSAIFSAFYSKQTNVNPMFQFQLEYVLDNAKTTTTGANTYSYPTNVRLKNTTETVTMEVQQGGDDWTDVDQSDWDLLLPDHVVAVYSGEEKRLWEEYYFRSYDEYNRQYRIGSNYRTQKMIYLNKYYWNVIASVLAIHTVDDYKAFLQKIGLEHITGIHCVFDQKARRENRNGIATEVLSVLNPKNKNEIDISLETYNQAKEICGYENEFFYNMIVLVLYKDFKIIKDLHIKCANGIEIKDLSEGEKKLLLIYGALNIVDGENLYLFDEPDAHLHEGRKEEIFNLIGENEQSQFVISSHSPTLTNLFDMKSVIMLDCTDGKVNVIYGDKAKAISVLTGGHWGFIDHTSFLNKSRPLLLVEGSGDVSYIKQAIKVLSSNKPDYKQLSHMDILHCGGASNMKETLSEIEPCLPEGKQVIVLFDRDEAGCLGLKSIINKGKDRQDTKTYKKGTYFYLKLPKVREHTSLDFVIEDYFTKEFKKEIAQSFLDDTNGEFGMLPKDLKQSVKDNLARNLETYDATKLTGFKVLLDKLLAIVNGTETVTEV